MLFGRLNEFFVTDLRGLYAAFVAHPAAGAVWWGVIIHLHPSILLHPAIFHPTILQTICPPMGFSGRK